MQVCVGTRTARVQGRHSGGERTAEIRCVEVVVVGTKNVVVSKKGSRSSDGEKRIDLLLQSREVSEEGAAVRSRCCRTQVDSVERRAEGAPVVPGNEASLKSLVLPRATSPPNDAP